MLGREDEIGSLEPGKLADLALWRVDGLGHAGVEDPVAALVFGRRPPLARLARRGPAVVEDGELVTDATSTTWPAGGRRRSPHACWPGASR